MAVAVVQSQAGTFSDGNAGHAVTFGSTATSGNLLVLTIASDTVVSTPSGWTLPTNGSRVGGQGAYLFYKVSAGSETGVTVTTSGNLATTFSFVEYSGTAASPFDVATNVGVDGTGATSTPSVTLTAAGAGELHVFVACLHVIGGAGTSPSWTGSVTQLLNSGYNATSPGEQQFYGHVLTAAGAATTTVASWSTQSASDRYTIAAAFKPATGGGSTNANAENVAWSMASQDPVASVGVQAGGVAFTVAAQDPVAGVGAQAGGVAFTVAAQDPTVDVKVNAEAATFSFAANDATVSTASQTNAPAENAPWTVAAQDPIAAIGVQAGNASFSIAGQDATVSTTSQTNAPAEVATFTLAGLDATVALGVAAGSAALTFAANDAVATIGREAPAQAATFAIAGLDATVAIGVPADVSAWSMAALDATGAVVLPFTIGALGASSSSIGALAASTAAGGPG